MSGLATILAIALSSGCLAAYSVHESPARGNAQVNEFPSALSMTKRKPVGMSLKTNAIPWTATIMNIAGEVNLSDKISLSVPVWWCPWFIGQSHALRVLALQPEGRWWFCKAGTGHFIGPHISVAWFNLRHNHIRYQDHGSPLLGAGLTYGYRLMLNRRLDLEFSIGAGYMTMRYDRFHNVGNGALINTMKSSYLGIDHAGVSLVYNFNL